jgi:hypothetical protein
MTLSLLAVERQAMPEKDDVMGPPRSLSFDGLVR